MKPGVAPGALIKHGATNGDCPMTDARNYD